VIQRFGDVKKLITQTIDPMLRRVFPRHCPQKTCWSCSTIATSSRTRPAPNSNASSTSFDIECVDVLIGKPDSSNKDGKIETLPEQLRQRQLSVEQLETFDRQKAAAEKLRALNEANAHASMQAQLTNAQLQVRIQDKHRRSRTGPRPQARRTDGGFGGSELNRSRRQADQLVVMADAGPREVAAASRADCRHRPGAKRKPHPRRQG